MSLDADLVDEFGSISALCVVLDLDADLVHESGSLSGVYGISPHAWY